ncbi:ESX secretion-associated protein EspG [Saccharopolyspora cebuensis]|uniref:ESX secretion-associated protein EspG n=1 Tax=Saccharopolyspora cebuensis TaxID=418759 RepID=A0ABV4CH94_9PSEU
MPSKLDVDRLEYVILAGWAGLTRIPGVASFSHYGRTPENINAELEAADQRCRERGLVDRGDRVNDAVWDLMGAYAHSSVEYDLRFSHTKGTELRACVTVAGQVAVRTTIDGDRFTLERVRPDEALPALMSLLPEHRPHKMRALGVDLAELRKARADLERRGETDERALDQLLRSRGVNIADYRQMTRLLDGKKLGGGEVGVTIWNRQRKEFRGEQTLRIIDLEQGRVAVYNSGGQRMVAGCDAGTVKRVLGGLAAETQRAAAF